MRKVPLVLVDDAPREKTYFENACKHPKMKQHFGADIEFNPIAILHDATMDSARLCLTIHECLQANQGWIVFMDRNLAGGVVAEGSPVFMR